MAAASTTRSARRPEIWSVGITRDGAFAGDPRWELTVEAEEDLAVTDIAFDNRGFMYLAQRGEIENRYDYSASSPIPATARCCATGARAPTIRRRNRSGCEVPQEYAVGFPEGHRQSAGGIDLQYGYDSQGNFNTNACTDTLVKTGDKLRDNPALAEQLAAGGPLAVHGVQITATSLVRPQNEPPFGSLVRRFRRLLRRPGGRRPCRRRRGLASLRGPRRLLRADPYPGGYPDPFWPPDFPPPGNYPPCIDVDAVEYFCTPAGLEADLYVRDVAGIGGDSVKADSRTPGVVVTPLQQTQRSGRSFHHRHERPLPGRDGRCRPLLLQAVRR